MMRFWLLPKPMLVSATLFLYLFCTAGAWAATEIDVFFSGDQAGYIEPCHY
ncbi:MAG: hypothetical protein K9J81_11790 [Desulfohalobiaceae bacterium]|nr:hypothetical protein [Desulfohalobiaceae bacterium]